MIIKPIAGSEIRRAFLDFFTQKGHKVIPSASLVPEGDPTLLFTSAGMVQFKPYFSGQKVPSHRRLTSCQKCFRTTDMDSVGDESHLTFFEMLGNFSVGDYFKEGAIELAWEFVTQWFELPPERLWATIYLDDDVARDIWLKMGVPEERILRFGKNANWWGPAGDTGPCGPDSEIFYDRGEEYGCGRPDCGPNCEYCSRYLELWNLVFMQYHMDEKGELTPLPQKNIDTGMGLERATLVMQGVSSIYETDLFAPLVERASEMTGVEYGSHEETDRSLRIIAEHLRAAAFLTTDGVMPANEGRGYVLRRILRKAIYHGRTLGREEPFLGEMVQAVGLLMGDAYPELLERGGFVAQVVTSEEERFRHTLDTGTHLLLALLEKAEVKKILSGHEVFRLYDTYGLPPDFTKEMAAARGMAVDEEGFQEAMAAQRERARAAHIFGGSGVAEALLEGLPIEGCEFVGYDTIETISHIVALIGGGERVAEARVGDEVQVVLQRTPFYAEAGGQVGDTGILMGPEGRARIVDTQSPSADFIVHYGFVEEGVLKEGDEVKAFVDKERRLDIMRNHTATHLLHKALRVVLGEHARQSGSLVAPDRLRFDFTHMAPLSPKEVREIEETVNAKIRDNLPVTTQVVGYEEAIAAGAVAIFGEKYGERVRMVSIDGYTRELCGGTHLSTTGQIGFFKILNEGSIGAGLRRIEALTGRGAEAYVERALTTLESVAERMGARPTELEERVAALLEELREKEREIARLRRREAKAEVGELLKKVEMVGGVPVLAVEVKAPDIASLREMTDWLRDRLSSAVIVLGTVVEGLPRFVAAVAPDLVERGLKAGPLVHAVAAQVGGGGGGHDDLAEGGGRDAAKMSQALAVVSQFVRANLISS